MCHGKCQISSSTELTLDPPEGIIAGPIDEENFFEWECLITGPDGTCFENGVFPARITFPQVCLNFYSWICQFCWKYLMLTLNLLLYYLIVGLLGGPQSVFLQPTGSPWRQLSRLMITDKSISAAPFSLWSLYNIFSSVRMMHKNYAFWKAAQFQYTPLIRRQKMERNTSWCQLFALFTCLALQLVECHLL